MTGKAPVIFKDFLGLWEHVRPLSAVMVRKATGVSTEVFPGSVCTGHERFLPNHNSQPYLIRRSLISYFHLVRHYPLDTPH